MNVLQSYNDISSAACDLVNGPRTRRPDSLQSSVSDDEARVSNVILKGVHHVELGCRAVAAPVEYESKT